MWHITLDPPDGILSDELMIEVTKQIAIEIDNEILIKITKGESK
jgi:hypothetical protein